MYSNYIKSKSSYKYLVSCTKQCEAGLNINVVSGLFVEGPDQVLAAVLLLSGDMGRARYDLEGLS